MKKFEENDINVAIVCCLNWLNLANEKSYDFGHFFSCPELLITFATGSIGKKTEKNHPSQAPKSDEVIKKDCKIFEFSCQIYQKQAIRYLILLIVKKWRVKEKNHHPFSRKSERHVLSVKDTCGRYLLFLADAFQVKVTSTAKSKSKK